MAYCIDQKLEGEICTINTQDKYLVGKISKIYEDKFAVNIFAFNNDQKIFLDDQVEIRIETLDNEIFFYVALIESQHILTANQIIFLKPISKLHDNNKRQYVRLKVETYFKTIYVNYRNFPPKKLDWNKDRLIDISEGGIQIFGEYALDKGQLVEIKLGPPFFDDVQFIICRVVNLKKSRRQYFTSIQFLNISNSNKEKLNEFIINTHKKVNEITSN